MPRSPRLHFPGAIYHVITRAVEGRGIFSLAEARERLLNDMAAVQERTHFTLHAFCVMTNHLHLLIQQGAVPISRVMQGILTRFAVWYNKSQERIGHVFQSRYSDFYCDSERYLLATLRYIHRNPVKAGMVESPADWAWSSHLDYLDIRKSGLVDTTLALSILHPNPSRARRIYRRFVEGGSDGPMPMPDDASPTPDSFIKRPSAPTRKPIDLLLGEVCASTGIIREAILGPSRSRPIAAARAQFAAAVLANGHRPLELVHLLNRSWAWISKIRPAKSVVSEGLTP